MLGLVKVTLTRRNCRAPASVLWIHTWEVDRWVDFARGERYGILLELQE